jgi:hypothetical protein
MGRSIVDIINDVLAQSGFLKKATFFNSNDPDDVQMEAIANRAALEITGWYPWESLRKVHNISLIDSQGVYDLPPDLKWIVSDSSWETDGSRKVDDHLSDNQWYQYKFSSLTSGGVIRARQSGLTIEVQEPFQGGEITFAYVTDFYAEANGSAKATFTSDIDEWFLDDQLLTLGIQAHWMQTKLMPQYQEHMINYKMKMNEAIGRDAVRNTIGGEPQQTRRAPYTKTWVN